jgi:hypothetical protein
MENYNKNINFKEIQYFNLINITFGILLLAFILAYILTEGYNEIPISIFFLVVLIILIPILLFYRLQLVVTRREIKIKYGIGLIKKTYLKNKLDTSKISITHIPWYYGVGIRIAKDGIIYNANPGKVLKIGRMDSNKYIYFGSNRIEDLISSIVQTDC